MNIAIIGLGYVGLPLCLQFARSGVRVLGLDIDAKKVSALNAGRSYIKHISAGEIKKLVCAGKFSASTDFAQIKNVAAILICVPTPLKKKSRTGFVLCAEHWQKHRAASAARAARRAGIHNVSWHDGK